MKGPDGMPGLPGSMGEKGIPGDKGSDGMQGLPGAMGEKGIPGDKGSDGMPGVMGEKGVMGDKGITGNKGPDGTAGSCVCKVVPVLPTITNIRNTEELPDGFFLKQDGDCVEVSGRIRLYLGGPLLPQTTLALKLEEGLLLFLDTFDGTDLPTGEIQCIQGSWNCCARLVDPPLIGLDPTVGDGVSNSGAILFASISPLGGGARLRITIRNNWASVIDNNTWKLDQLEFRFSGILTPFA